MLHTIFRTSIYRPTFNYEVQESELDFFDHVMKKPKQNKKNLISNEIHVLDNKEFSTIKEFINVQLNQYIFKYYGKVKKDTIFINTSWLNVTKPGMSHHQHTHPNSLVSGVFYFNCIPNDSIIFSNPNPLDNVFFFSHFTEEGANKCNTLVDTGTLVIFPSWLSHEVVENESDEDRKSLSFNTWVKGPVLEETDISKIPDIQKQ